MPCPAINVYNQSMMTNFCFLVLSGMHRGAYSRILACTQGWGLQLPPFPATVMQLSNENLILLCFQKWEVLTSIVEVWLLQEVDASVRARISLIRVLLTAWELHYTGESFKVYIRRQTGSTGGTRRVRFIFEFYLSQCLLTFENNFRI
jgi:hypothetical protein